MSGVLYEFLRFTGSRLFRYNVNEGCSMQMRRSYQTTNRRIRAAQLRADAHQLARSGFQDSAAQNLELAAELDPPVVEAVSYEPQHNAAVEVRKGKSNTHNADVQSANNSATALRRDGVSGPQKAVARSPQLRRVDGNVPRRETAYRRPGARAA